MSADHVECRFVGGHWKDLAGARQLHLERTAVDDGWCAEPFEMQCAGVGVVESGSHGIEHRCRTAAVDGASDGCGGQEVGGGGDAVFVVGADENPGAVALFELTDERHRAATPACVHEEPVGSGEFGSARHREDRRDPDAARDEECRPIRDERKSIARSPHRHCVTGLERVHFE